MGFLDSLKGLGRAASDIFTGAVETLGPLAVDIGGQFLREKFLPQPQFPTGIFPQRQQPGFGFPQQFPRQPQPGFRTAPLPAILDPLSPALFGGATVPFFPLDRTGPVSLPGGFMPAAGSPFNIPGFDLQLPIRSELSACPQFFRAGGATARPIPLVMVQNPVTGAPVFYRHAGRPILFSGDLNIARRVDKLARRARRSRPRPR